MRRTYHLFLMISIYFIFFAPISYAQIFTFDYLSFADNNPDFSPSKKWMLTQYLFGGFDEFDENGRAKGDIAYAEWRLFISYTFYNSNHLKMSTAILSSAILARDALTGGWLTPWIWIKYKCSARIPLWLRIGYQFGKLGTDPWVEDNKLDMGLLYHKLFGTVAFNTAISYRIRGRIDVELVTPKINSSKPYFDQYGNEIHTKFEWVKNISMNKQLSVIYLAYYSSDMKYQGQNIRDTEAFKIALGASIYFHKKSGQMKTLSFLWDTWGRFDKRGFSIVYQVNY